ncbi:MAG: hypothetical protein L6R30_26540 [Thermoanaerobaculia bacterium]|nr:hypothetical protein [Thermoanaerobaculia bacterium]MCK6685970.1 hypothetical protein [Thermoanaerobaculia bacterium]
MNEEELIGEVIKRTGVPEEQARAVLKAVREISSSGDSASAQGLSAANESRPAAAPPVRSADELISCARSHPLGLEFLRRGYLGSVAAEFGVNAFTVEEARVRLEKDRPCAISQEVKA